MPSGQEPSLEKAVSPQLAHAVAPSSEKERVSHQSSHVGCPSDGL